MNNFAEKYGPWALVTGASSGIGKEMATQLAAKGLNVVIVARRQNLLDSLKTKLMAEYKVEVLALQADFYQKNAAKHIEEITSELDIGLVIPNAGAEMVGEFVDADVNENTALVQLNTVVPMQIANLFGPRLKKRGRGGMLFVSSLFGYQGIPYVANYAATKAYILGLGEALNVELGKYGVDVSVLSPGLTSTEMPSNMPINFKKIPMFSMKTSRAVRIGLNALGNKATVVPGLLNKIYAWENRFIPRTWPVSLFGFLIRRALTHDRKPVPHLDIANR